MADVKEEKVAKYNNMKQVTMKLLKSVFLNSA